jgi:hypothetical protein
LYFYDGNEDNEITLVGPIYNQSQGKTGLEVESVVDENSNEHVVVKLFIAGNLFAVITDASFRLAGSRKIIGYPDDSNDNVFPPRQLFEQGFNLVNSNSLYRGIAESARFIADLDGNLKTTSDFLEANKNEETTGSLFIKNQNGLTIGLQDTAYSTFKVLGSKTTIENQISGTDIVLRTKIGSQFKDALYITGQTDRIGLFNNNPEYVLDVNGDFRTTNDAVIEGDLIVKGNASYFNVQTLQVFDKNIELGLLDDSTEADDETIDGGGITLRSNQGSKDLFWDKQDNSWTSNVNFNLQSSKSYKINGQNVLSLTELGPTISTANGLTSIGTLKDLAVDDLRFDTNIISAPTVNGTEKNIILDPSASVSVSNSNIVDLNDPINNQDAATKKYVDTRVDSSNVALSLDITGLDLPSPANPYQDVLNILESISPASEKVDGTIARIHGVSYDSITITGIDIAGAMDKQYVTINNIQDPFDLEDNLTAESVVQDVNFDPANAVFTPVPNRLTFTFIVSGSQWNWQSTE